MNFEVMKNQFTYRLLTLVLLLGMLMPSGAQEIKKLTLLQTSDVHSRVEPIDQEGDRNYNEGGMVRRVTMLKEMRQKNPDLVLFDCGDISQGTPYYNLFKGEVEVKMMNEMGYDAMTIGNHEFDFGLDNMARLFRMAEFPVVCANYGVDSTVLKGLVEPYTIIERDGLRIGVFGLGCQLEGMVQANKCEGVVFKDPVKTAIEIVDILKNTEGCDLVVCLSHLGVQYDKETLIPRTNGIDVVLGGHSHTFMDGPVSVSNKDGEEIPLMHTGKSGIYVGELDLTLEPKKN